MRKISCACLFFFALPLLAQKPPVPAPAAKGQLGSVTCSRLANGDSLCYGSVRMSHVSNEHQRGAEFRAPAMLLTTTADGTTNGRPVVQVTIETIDDRKLMVPDAILVQRIASPAGDYLQINITAINPTLEDRVAEYQCHLTIIGKIDKKK